MKPGRHGYEVDRVAQARWSAETAVARAMDEAHAAGYKLALAHVEREIYSAEDLDELLSAVSAMTKRVLASSDPLH